MPVTKFVGETSINRGDLIGEIMTETTTWMIETIDLSRIYRNGDEIRALDNVNMHISPGELVTVMGPSGSGKSTLLNVIGALDLPTSGKVNVNGHEVSKIRDKDDFRSSTIGFIFQLHNLIPTLNARENIEIPMMGHLGARARKKRAEELLELVDLADRMNHLPNQLSGGQRQRVAVARALANNPPLVLADEPTGSLDTKASLELMNLLKDLNQSQGTTFVVVTHDLNVARQTERVLVMADGKIVRQDVIGSPIEEDLKQWQHSGLGQRILAQDEALLSNLELSTYQIEALQKVLAPTNG
jgi:ABC-type lipoprotein export system ATPase subunit